jgi:outer membrane immunogenic protein
MLRFAASATALAMISSAAVAADLPIMPPPPPPPVLTTPIVFNWSGLYVGAHGGWGFGHDLLEDGFVVGGQVGYNWQFNQFLLGVEGDGSFVDWGEIEAVGTARLRGGWAIDRFLLYATGGGAFGADEVGWVAGAGGEFAITDNFSAGVEYLHYDEDESSSDVIRGRINVTFNSQLGM